MSGPVITVVTSSGGSGGTTLAVNLADELRLAGCGPGLIVDLDLDYGAVAAYLGVRAERGVADVLGKVGPIGARDVTSAASIYLDDLHVLTSSASVDFDDPRLVHFDRLGDLVEACRGAYGSTVIDAPRGARDTTAQLAAASDLTLVVFQLTVTSVRCARAQVRSLRARGVPAGRVLAVANRHSRGHMMLALEDAEEALEGVSVASVANDFEAALRSINYGRPLSSVAPSSAVRRDLRELALQIGAPLERAGKESG